MIANVKNKFNQADVVGDNILDIGGTINILTTGTLNIPAGATVNIDSAANFPTAIKTALVTATLAELNTGKILIPAVAGKSISILDYKAKVIGNFATTVSVDVRDTSMSPVIIASAAVAALTNGNILNEKTSNVTMGAGYLAALPVGTNVAALSVGATATGGTSIVFRILYIVA